MEMPIAPPDRRRFGRRQTFVHATIIARGRSPISCIIRDVSDTGALLEVANPQWLPSRFSVVIELDGSLADCEVVRRTDTAVGVRFITPRDGTLFLPASRALIAP